MGFINKYHTNKCQWLVTWSYKNYSQLNKTKSEYQLSFDQVLCSLKKYDIQTKINIFM